MGKKSFAYQPARIVTGASRWYIVWYAPSLDDSWHRYRETFSLNRIHDLRLRKKRAVELAQKINWWLDQGLPAWDFSENGADRKKIEVNQPELLLGNTPVIDALDYALKLKTNQSRRGTAKSYRSVTGMVIAFLKERGWDQLPVNLITKGHGGAYMDTIIVERNASSTTYNNNLRYLRAIWALLKERGYVDANVFQEISYKKKSAKIRRNFTMEEGRVVMRRIKETSELLFYGLLLEYCCYIRPSELLRLRRGNIHLEERFVEVPGREAKTYEERFPAIPDSFVHFFRKEFFEAIPDRYYLFGYGFEPHPSLPCGDGTMYRKHRKVLEQLKKEGLLSDITGLQYYSWKDTGITDALEHLPLLFVQDQAGHSTPEMTLKYRHKKSRNDKFRQEFPNKMI